MTNLYPGGRRRAHEHRIFGAENIRRFIRSRKPNHAADADTSIATRNRRTGKPHEHRREIARRLRQAGGAA